MIYRPLQLIELDAVDNAFDWADGPPNAIGMIENKDIWLTATGTGNFVLNINGIDHTWGINAVQLFRVIPYHRMLRTIDITSVPAGGKLIFVLARRPVS